jgi:hypothetical protein
MDGIRRLLLSCFKNINPISDMVYRMAGKQWYATPDFWDVGYRKHISSIVSP